MSDLIFIGVLVWSIVLMMNRRAKVTNGTIVEERLTRGEKIQVWITCILNPVIAGAIYYFGWRKRLPMKARSANKISWIAFAAVLLLIVIGTMLHAILGHEAYTEITIPGFSSSTTPAVISQDQTSPLVVSVFQDGHMSVKNTTTGSACESKPYGSIDELYISLDSSHLQFFAHGDLNHPIIIDTVSCSEISPK